MALTKRTYVDGETIITAQNLNDIQDEVRGNIRNVSYDSASGKIKKTTNSGTSSDVVTVDSTPTQNSKNPVQSGGVFEEIDEINNSLNTSKIRHAEYRGDLPTGTDLNDVVGNGWWFLSNGGTYANTPESIPTTGQRFLFVVGGGGQTSTSFRYQIYFNRAIGLYATRICASSTWSWWTTNQNYLLSQYLVEAITSRQPAIGTDLRIATYNVAGFNNNSATQMPDNKIIHFRKWLAQANLNFLCVQEGEQYVDTNKGVYSYLMRPLLPDGNNYGSNWRTAIFSQISYAGSGVTNAVKVKYSTGVGSTSYNIMAAVYVYGSYRLLVVAAHCNWNADGTGGNSASNIAERKQEYKDIFEWITGQKQLQDIGSTTLRSCPSHTHAVVCMDANSIDSSKQDLIDAATANGFVLGNGGRFGWFKTCADSDGAYALDQIACSSNIVIRDIDAQWDWYNRLYSDHVPVVADITLTNATGYPPT